MPAEISPYSRLTALLLCWPLGICGAHRFYVGRGATGVLQLLTLGGLQFWMLIDVGIIISGSFTDADGRPVRRWTWRGADLQLSPILKVAAATSALIGIWIGVIAPTPASTFAQVVWPLLGVQAMGGLVMGFAVDRHRFLHAVAACVVGSYFVYPVVTVVGLLVVGGDSAQGVGFVAMMIAGLLYLVTPVVGLLGLVGGATDEPDAASRGSSDG